MTSMLSPYYKVGDLIFISGQVGMDLETKNIPKDFESQAKNTLLNLEKILRELKLTKKNVAKVNVYLTDLTYFNEFNSIYSSFFAEHKPARTAVEVSRLPEFPGDPTIFIEIDAIVSS